MESSAKVISSETSKKVSKVPVRRGAKKTVGVKGRTGNATNTTKLGHTSGSAALHKTGISASAIETENRVEIAIERVAERIAEESRVYDELISTNSFRDAEICEAGIDALLLLRERLYQGDRSVLSEIALR